MKASADPLARLAVDPGRRPAPTSRRGQGAFAAPAWRKAGGAACATAGLAAASALALAIEAPLPGAIAAAGFPAAFALGLVALRRANRLQRQADKLSGDLDVLSQCLIQLEARAIAAEAGAKPPPAPDGRVEELTAEMGLWGEIVRDLTVAVAAHDRDVAALKHGRAEALRAVGPPPSLSPKKETAPRPQLVAVPPTAPPPPLADPSAAAGPPPSHAELRRAAAILAAIDEDRIEVHLQSVVSLPQRKVRLYEALARLRLDENTLLVPAEFLPVLESHGRVCDLDRSMLNRAATIARHMAARGSDALIACNIAPDSLAETGFLRAVGRLVDANPDLSGRLVLELPQRCWRTLDAEQAGGLGPLRERGVVFSLDHATDLRLDPLSLADRGVRFVKLSAAMLLDPAVSRRLDVEMGDLPAALARAGIHLVAERVEREEEVPDLIDLDVPLAQGLVFGPPRPVRSDVMTGLNATSTLAASLPAPQTLSEAAPPEPAPSVSSERLPFRAFLRRAS